MQLISQTAKATLAAHHPEAATELDRLSKLLYQSEIPEEILQLCQAHLQSAIDTNAPPPTAADPSSLASACLDLCEQFRVSVSGVSDDQIQRLLTHLSADEVYNLCSAIYVMEMSHKLSRTLEAVVS